MPVVSHHPIIIHLECIACGLFSVYINLAVFHRKCIIFIMRNRTFVQRQIVQIANPAAIVDPDSGESFSEVPASLHHYTSVGAGCGMGQSDAAAEALSDLFSRLSGRKADPDIQAHTRDSARNMPGLVLDADALNMIAAHPGLAAAIPPGSILTPHTRELSRLMLCLYPELDLDFAGWKYPWTGPRLDRVMDLADRLSEENLSEFTLDKWSLTPRAAEPPAPQRAEGAVRVKNAPAVKLPGLSVWHVKESSEDATVSVKNYINVRKPNTSFVCGPYFIFLFSFF